MANTDWTRQFPGEGYDEYRARLNKIYSGNGQLDVHGDNIGAPPPPPTMNVGDTGQRPRDLPLVSDVPEPSEEDQRAQTLESAAPDFGASAKPSVGDPRQLALSIDPKAELERIRSMPPPDYRGTAGRVLTDGGDRQNFMGYEDEVGFKRAEKIKQAQEAYKALPTETSRRWEDEFLADRKRYTDDDIHRGYVLQTLMSGSDAGLKFRQMARGEQEGYDKGLMSARERDAGSQRISSAMAEAIAATGQVSPEAAAQLKLNDPIVKQFGQFASQGGRAEGQQLARDKVIMQELAKLSMRDEDRQANRENTVMRGALGIQAALANKGVKSDGTLPDATNLEWATKQLKRQVPGLSDEQARTALLSGDTSGLTPEQARDVDLATAAVKAAANDPVARRTISTSQGKLEGEAEEKQKNAVELAIAKSATDPDYRVKMEQDLEARRLELKAAFDAWTTMSDAGKKAFVQFARSGIPAKLGDFVSHLGMEDAQQVTEDDRAKATALQALFNSVIQKRAGVAVTESEMGRVAAELGLANGSWDPFNSVKGVGNTLNRIGATLRAHQQIYKKNILDWNKR
jgi:hypothetical protein